MVAAQGGRAGWRPLRLQSCHITLPVAWQWLKTVKGQAYRLLSTKRPPKWYKRYSWYLRVREHDTSTYSNNRTGGRKRGQRNKKRRYEQKTRRKTTDPTPATSTVMLNTTGQNRNWQIIAHGPHLAICFYLMTTVSEWLYIFKWLHFKRLYM